MIYYNTAKERSTGNEWVIETFSNAEDAARHVELCRKRETNQDISYRVDTLDNPKAEEKMRLNSLYGRSPELPPETFYETDSMREYTEKELFQGKTVHDLGSYDVQECNECGAIISDPEKHTEWHNKLLP